MKRTKFLVFTLTFFGSLFSEETQEHIWKPITRFELKDVSDIDVSPNGKSVVYSVTKTNYNQSENSYSTQIWKGDVDDPDSHFQFTTSNYDSDAPKWSPDGKWIAFLSSRAGRSQLFLISAFGGEAHQITDMKCGVISFKWSPQGQYIAFISSEEEKEPELPDHYSKDAVTYPSQYGCTNLYVTKAEPSILEPKKINPDDFSVYGRNEWYDWSFNEESLVFCYKKNITSFSFRDECHLAICSAHKNEIDIKKIEDSASFQCCPRFSPDGKFIAFIKNDPNLLVSTINALTIYDVEKDEIFEVADTFEKNPSHTNYPIVGWYKDSQSVFYIEPYKTKNALWRVPIDGSAPVRYDNDTLSFSSVEMNATNEWMSFSAETLNKPCEAFITSTNEFKPKKITNVNKSVEKYEVPKAEIVHWKSFDDTEVEGILIYPKDYNPEKTYPLIVNVHGGPLGAFHETYIGSDYLYPTMALAYENFFIFKPNPRGSNGYGIEFRHGNQNDWGGGDYKDIMTGVDHLIEKGLIDQERMGVMGWSYGGYMTGWIVSQTDRFAAASMGAGLSNLISFTGTTDVIYMLREYFSGESWENQDLYIERSPITYANNVSTPLLIQHAYGDFRVPFSQSKEYYNALLKQDKVVELIGYPRSGHTVCEPELRLDVLQRNFDWFLEKVKNKSLHIK